MRPDRTASIAAMGYRLAAAGPRTRQRLIDRENVPKNAGPPDPPEHAAVSEQIGAATPPVSPLVAYVDRWPLSRVAEPVAAEPAMPRGAPSRARMIATLGFTAACGFGLVLASQSHIWKRQHVVLAAVTKPQEISAPEPPKPQERALAQTAAPAPKAPEQNPKPVSDAPEQRQEPPEPSTAPVSRPVAAPPKPAAPRPAAKPVVPAQPVQLAHLARPARPAKLAFVHAAPRAERFAAAKSHAPEMRVANHELPRWLTEDHPSPARGLVMSDPPHDLSLPSAPHQEEASRRPAPAESRMGSAVPAPAQRQMVIANATPPYGGPTQVPLREPGYRPFEGPVRAYYGPYYPPPAPYGQPYPRGW
jgi:hypothetical protein